MCNLQPLYHQHDIRLSHYMIYKSMRNYPRIALHNQFYYLGPAEKLRPKFLC